jgi:pyruvate formate lyase activating enzyme
LITLKNGRIHSVETMGTVDGPGIRYVVFTQGCPMRCVFCHNRDAWDPKGGNETTVDELMEEIRQYLPFYKSSGGGVTATGGEPTMQAEFVRDLFSRVKNELGLNTAMDTSGFVDISRAKSLLEVTDLVLLSIKHIDEIKHKAITGVSSNKVFAFMEYLREINKRLWIRYVVIPGLTDDKDDVVRLAEFLKEFPNIELVDILPYHTMGVYKWQELGLDYPLEGVSSPDKESVREIKEIFKEYGFQVNL